MPRTIEVSVPPQKTDPLLSRLKNLEGVVGLALHRGASIDPPGDVMVVQATTDGTRTVLNVLSEMSVTDGGSILTSEPRSLIAPDYQNGIDIESNETIWDEMAFLLRRDTNLSTNYLAAMALAGVVAAGGLWTDTVHVVVGSMVIAPGFEPLLRIPFGWICGLRGLALRGVASTAVGYLALAVAAALTTWVLAVVAPQYPPDLTTRTWVQYWSSVTPAGVLVALAAGAAGAVVVAGQRSVLTTGVMIALALIPSMSVVGMGLASGNLSLAVGGLARWATDAAAVLLSGAVVIGLKQVLVHRRHALS